MIASTAADGINLFRPNFNPVPESSSSEDEQEMKHDTIIEEKAEDEKSEDEEKTQ